MIKAAGFVAKPVVLETVTLMRNNMMAAVFLLTLDPYVNHLHDEECVEKR